MAWAPAADLPGRAADGVRPSGRAIPADRGGGVVSAERVWSNGKVSPNSGWHIRVTGSGQIIASAPYGVDLAEWRAFFHAGLSAVEAAEDAVAQAGRVPSPLCMIDVEHGSADYEWTLEASPDPPVLLCGACLAVLRRGVESGEIDPPTRIRRIQQEAES
jgi:hypothetical protein